MGKPLIVFSQAERTRVCTVFTIFVWWLGAKTEMQKATCSTSLGSTSPNSDRFAECSTSFFRIDCDRDVVVRSERKKRDQRRLFKLLNIAELDLGWLIQ